MPKFLQNSGKLCGKKTIKKVNFMFFLDFYVPNLKLHAKPPLLGNYTTLPGICLWNVFSMLGIKTINNMEVTLYGNP